MTEHGSFYRKITYLMLIAVLLFPISQLGAPATTENAGGSLAQLRAEYDLGQSDLGEIDPASETIRLATLGLRGVAVSMLWTKANEYKMKEDWTNFRATLGQLSSLQPYFIKFWQFQAWNLTYNVSVELDDVRDRFHYVKRGIEFLKRGITYNRNSPYLLSELGWFIGNKIGRADEHKEYRRLFKADDDFHPEDRPLEQRDNWLVSKDWYNRSIDAVGLNKKGLGQKNPVTFYSNPAKSQINYSEAIEDEGTFGEKAKSSWATAARMWRDFGNREITSSLGPKIFLGQLDRLTEETLKLQTELEELSESAREEVVAAKRAKLTPEQIALLDGPQSDLPDEQWKALQEAKELVEVTPDDLANFIAEKYPKRVTQARRLAKQIVLNRNRMRLTGTNRDVVNFEYWKIRCAVEQTPEALRARELAYAGYRVFKVDADLIEAKRLYEESFAEWAKTLEAFPEMALDSATGSDIMEYIDQYSAVLQQLDRSLNDDDLGSQFPLWQIIDENDTSGEYNEGLDKFFNAEQPEDDSTSTDAESTEAEATEATADDADSLDADSEAAEDTDEQPTPDTTDEAETSADSEDPEMADADATESTEGTDSAEPTSEDTDSEGANTEGTETEESEGEGSDSDEAEAVEADATEDSNAETAGDG